MKRWHRNVALSGLKTRLPFRNELRHLARAWVPSPPLSENDDYYFENALEMVGAARDAGVRIGGRYIEIGTGWTPILSVCFFAAGAEEIELFDLHPYLDAKGARRAQLLVRRGASRLATVCGRSEDDVLRRIDAYRYRFHCPFDVARLEGASADLVATRAVLEHVPEAALPALYAGLARALKPGGSAVHLIDNSDHFEHQDKSISRVNFLRYSDEAWRLIEALAGERQNRLRHSDHRALLAASGLSIVAETAAIDSGALAALRLLKLAPRFAACDPENLATLKSLFVLKKTT